MKLDIHFAIWCARRCLHLWNAPDEVKDWLENTLHEEVAKTTRATRAAARAARAARAAARAAAVDATGAAEAEAACATWAATWAADAVAYAAIAAEYTAKALHTTVAELRLEYVKTWTDDELGKAEGNWIEIATIEILNRM